jgi:hypothetical protein
VRPIGDHQHRASRVSHRPNHRAVDSQRGGSVGADRAVADRH